MEFDKKRENEGAKILIVDDNRQNIQVLAHLLERAKFEVTAVTNGNSALLALSSKKFDMVLLDIMMPQMDGFETCKLIKENEFLKDIPIIFITALTDSLSIARAFKVGGVDFISKPFNPTELLARVNTHLSLQKRTNELKEALRRENILATTDSLTGIYNRMKFDTLLEEQIKIAKRYNEPLSVIFFDIDHFKKINDTYGHKIGDKVLIKLAKLIKSSIRSCDVFARWGGEEFIIYLPKTPLKESIEIAEKLKVIVSKHPFGEVEKITCSFGVSTLEEGDTQDSLLLRVDKALYNAKENGRNRVEFL